MSDDERKELNLIAGEFLKSLGFNMAVTENTLREGGFVGYAEFYLQLCYDDFELRNEAQTEIYKELIEIDAQLGTTHTEQLFGCVYDSVRMDLIKVKVIFDILKLKLF